MYAFPFSISLPGGRSNYLESPFSIFDTNYLCFQNIRETRFNC